MTINKVLGIVGSPRKKGNTDLLVDEVILGTGYREDEFTKVYLSDCTIGPCKHCSYCEKHGKCIQEDSLVDLLKLMDESDVWILGTPVYFWGPTAQFKTFLDRWFGIRKDVFNGKRAIVVMPLGASSEHYARHAVGIIKDSCDYKGLQIVDFIIATGVYERGEVEGREALLSRAKKAGASFLK